MKTPVLFVTFLATATACSTLWASPYVGTGQYFINPAGWNVSDPGSTHQAWDDLTALAGNVPDGGFSANPAVGTSPILSGNAPAFRTGSGNLYSFSGPYSAFANIYNHGTPGTDGTHVLVQTAASKNTYSAIPTSMKLVDLAGVPLAGGDNASALVNAGLLAAGTVNSTMGPVTYEVLVWEFFLPTYTGDFRVEWTEDTDSSFDQLRVDSFLTPSALTATSFSFQPIPEPGTFGISVLGLLGVFVGSRCRKGSSAR